MLLPKRHYLLKAMLDWVHDCDDIPYLLADVTCPGVNVPPCYAQDGHIVLNINPEAVCNLNISEDGIGFDARFSGVSHRLHIPLAGVLAIYGANTGEGLVFPAEPAVKATVMPIKSKKPGAPTTSLKVLK